jgi:hypothetical protein
MMNLTSTTIGSLDYNAIENKTQSYWTNFEIPQALQSTLKSFVQKEVLIIIPSAKGTDKYKYISNEFWHSSI